MNTKKKKEKDIFNIATFFNIARIVLLPLVIILLFSSVNRWWVVLVFAIAAITDALDGFAARKYNLVSEFGRRLDMFADRIFMVGLVIATIIYFNLRGMDNELVLIGLIMIREVIALPFLIFALISKKEIFPQARKIAKFTTLLQGITFPMILLGWPIAVYFAGLTAITGIISGILYAKDSCFSR